MIKSGVRYIKALTSTLLILGLCSCATPGNVAFLQGRLKESPEDFKAHLELAKACIGKGIKWEGAPEIGTPVLVNKKWVKKAQRELEKAAEIDPVSLEPHYWLKITYNAMGKYAAADEEVRIINRLFEEQKEGPGP
ncbi:MAG TPA: hypothetical protein ACFYD3_07595 [Candidatus Hypogeohydataceae bacterium YC41]